MKPLRTLAPPLLLVLLLLLSGCVAYVPAPLPKSDWDVPEHPLYPPTVWVETGGGLRGGGVVVSSTDAGTYVLTAYHVVSGAKRLRVGAFRHSIRRSRRRSPEYRLYTAELVAGGDLLEESVRAAYEECADAIRALVMAGGGSARFPALSRILGLLEALNRALSEARESDDVAAAIERFLGADPLRNRDRQDEEFRRARSAGGPAIALRVDRAFDGAREAAKRILSGRNAVVYDVALLRLRTPDRLRACQCLPPGAAVRPGVTGSLVSIQPDGEPKVHQVRLGAPYLIEWYSTLEGRIEAGHSGSPVFAGRRLAGILTSGLYPEDEEPGETFETGAFVRIDDIRRWLARKNLDAVLNTEAGSTATNPTIRSRTGTLMPHPR